jgi:DNA-binding NtrC family response regulator
VLKLADQIAPADATVLITGESGTGKEVVARWVHRKSRRANGAFVAINCAAIPETLLESELFGHEKGAFTGAVARRLGKFEEATGGTLLLDEISEIAPRLQAKLLRAIQEREIDRIGGGSPVKIDVRLIATSNRDLEAAVRAGEFREDLYYRLNVMQLALPPLRQRPDDVPALAEHFARKYSTSNGLAYKALTDGAVTKLKSHSWRGNVRELENTMHRAVLLSPTDSIEPDAILLQGGHTSGPAPSAAPIVANAGDARSADTLAAAGYIGRTVAEVERDLILGTLTHTFGNRTHAANILGISIRTLRNKLKEYSESGIRVPMPGEGERASV